MNNRLGQEDISCYSFNKAVYAYAGDLVFQDLAADLLLSTSFIDQNLQDIFPAKHKLVPWHLGPVEILTQSSNTINVVSFADHESATAPANKTRHNLVVSKKVTLVPSLHTPVMVTRTCSGFLTINPVTIIALAARPCRYQE